jgi:hypothetical protein
MGRMADTVVETARPITPKSKTLVRRILKTTFRKIAIMLVKSGVFVSFKE